MKHKVSITVLVLLIFWLLGCDKEVAQPLPASPKIGSLSTNLSATTKVLDNKGNEYSIGWQTGGYQDPFIQKKSPSGDLLWKVVYETTNVDGRGTMIFLDENHNPWAVFTVDGGDNTINYINKKNIEDGAFSGVYSGGYGSGGGPVVSIVARINPSTGKIAKGTFITAKKSDGKTNSFKITKIGTKNGRIAFDASSVAWPPSKGTSYSRYPEITDADRIDNTFFMYYEMKPDLSEIVEAVLYRK